MSLNLRGVLISLPLNVLLTALGVPGGSADTGAVPVVNWVDFSVSPPWSSDLSADGDAGTTWRCLLLCRMTIPLSALTQ